MKKYSIFQKNRSSGNMTWYGRISEDGVFRTMSLGVTRKADAQEWLNLMNSRKFLPEDAGKAVKDVPIRRCADKFIDYASFSGASGLTVRAYRTRLGTLTEWCEEHGRGELSEVKPSDALDFTSFLASRYSPRTSGEIIKLAKAVYGFAATNLDYSGKNPFEGIRRPKRSRSMKSFWTPEQIDAILGAAPSAEYRRFWALMAFAGLRYFEASNIDGADIRDGRITILGKGGKPAGVPVSDRLASELRGIPESGPLFTDPSIRNNTMSIRELRKAVRLAGIPLDQDSNNHRFRHSFASNLLNAGADIREVQRLMRHESVQITLDVYGHLVKDGLKSTTDLL